MFKKLNILKMYLKYVVKSNFGYIKTIVYLNWWTWVFIFDFTFWRKYRILNRIYLFKKNLNQDKLLQLEMLVTFN